MDTLFSNVTIVTMDEAMHVYFDAYLGVTDGKISYLAREAPKEKTKRLVPGEGMVLMPGLINCHTHLPMSVLARLCRRCRAFELAQRLYLPA